jgi:DNA-binding MarR family transcriptional regulator
MASKDIVRDLGYLTLGTRFKRIGERLQADTQVILDAHELGIQAGQCPFVAAIDRSGSLSIGELAEAVGVTQPAVTRAIAQLVKEGFVSVTASDADQRRKHVSLTAEGKRLLAASKRVVWPAVEQAVRDLCEELTGPLLAQLIALEEGLGSTPLHRRAKVSAPGRRK